MNKNIIFIIIVILVGAGSFFGGMQYQKAQRVGRSGQFAGQGGQFFSRAGGLQGGRPVAGSILSSDDTSITVKLADGSSKIVLFSGTTVVNKQTTGSKSDLTTGSRILVIGKENSDGSITAETISLNPNFQRIEVTPQTNK